MHNLSGGLGLSGGGFFFFETDAWTRSTFFGIGLVTSSSSSELDNDFTETSLFGKGVGVMPAPRTPKSPMQTRVSFMAL